MSIASEISRLTTLRNGIRTKLISLEMMSDESADLSDCKDALDNIIIRSAGNITIGDVIIIPNGYYLDDVYSTLPTGYKYYYTGASAPTSSVGDDGDLYLQTVSSNWLIDNAEFVSTIYEASYTMDQTGYNTWTPSSTATAIIASSDVSQTFSADMANYEYLLRWRVDFTGVYTGSNAKGKLLRQCCEALQCLYRRPTTPSNVQSIIRDTNVCATQDSHSLVDYYSSASARAIAANISYGIYIAATAATFSNDTSTSPTVTFKTPVVNARCSSTYFSTTMAGNLTKASSTVVMIGELYRMPIKSSPRSYLISSLVDMYNNSLTVSSS